MLNKSTLTNVRGYFSPNLLQFSPFVLHFLLKIDHLLSPHTHKKKSVDCVKEIGAFGSIQKDSFS